MIPFSKTLGASIILVVACFLFAEQHMPAASAAESGAKAIFDVRIGKPLSAANHLKLIYQTYKDLKADGKTPEVVVVFIGPSVKLISTNREGFAGDELKSLNEIASTVTAMSKDGVKLEICMFAANVFHVDPASVLPEIQKVPNGWVSLIDYQSRGYSLVPAY
jgi:intracellular sulfur oxidation DsrE/DsrF family protein